MRTLGYYNGQCDELERITVPMLDRACYFGDGVYDVTYSRHHHIYALKEHVTRFYRSAEQLRITPPMTQEALCALLSELITRLDCGEAWIYMQFSRGTALRDHAFPADASTNLWIMMKPMEIKDTYRPMRCILREDTRHHHCNIKSLNLIPNVLATQETVEAGMDECILHRGDTVTECAHSNLSILKDGVLITHPADRWILAGTGRAHLLALCNTLGVPVLERTYTVEKMLEADEILITSASALCIRVSQIEGRPVGGKAPTLVKTLQDALLKDFLEKTE